MKLQTLLLKTASALVLCLIALCTTAHAGFVYAVTDSTTANMIYGFSVNETTGELTALNGFPMATGFIGSGLTNLELAVIDPVNKRLYVGNRGSSNVTAYSIDTATGALTPMPFSPITTVANERTLKVHPSGSPLIIGADSFASFVITPTTATAAPGSPYALPAGVSPSVSTLTPDGSYYYAGGNSGNFFGGYAINSSTGEMTEIPGNPFDSGSSNPVPTATDSGRLYVSSSRQSLARVYTLAAGVPTAVTNSPFSLTESGFAAVGRLDPTGNFWVQPNRTRNHVYSLAISGSGAATSLAVVAGSPFLTGGTTSEAMVFNAAGDNIFVANGGSRNITRFAFDPVTGVLSGQAVQAANTLGADGSISGIAYIAGGSAVSVPVSVGGRLISSGGRGIKATITIEDAQGVFRTTLASSFGYYRFDNLASGTEYTVRAESKVANFTPRTLTPAGDVLDFDITEAVGRSK